MKQIVPLWQDFIDCVCDPQQSIADIWLGSWNDSAVKQVKEHCLPFKSSLNIRNLPKILNFYNWYDKQMSNLTGCITENIKLSLALVSDSGLQPRACQPCTWHSWMSNLQECPLRTSLTSLSPFPFKVC